MTRGCRVSSVAVCAALVLLLASAGAAAAGKGKGKAEQIRDYLDRATAAFALNHFADAADNYEKAFALKPDAAVLYNAAQAHRLAGSKVRALELYQSYLRLYGAEKRAEVERHIEDLKQAIEKDHAVATSPPTTPAPVSGAGGAAATVPEAPPPEAPPAPQPAVAPVAAVESPPAAPVAATAPAPAPVPPPAPVYAAPPAPVYAAPRPVLIAQPQQRPAPHRSVFRKAWFWFVVGAVVAAGVATTVLATRREDSDPVSTLNPVNGN